MLNDITSREITARIIKSAIEVHKALGPGLLDHAYIACLRLELQREGLALRERVPVPAVYKGVPLGTGYTIDILVENEVIVQVRAVNEINWVHKAEVLTCLRMARLRVGLLINFNVPVLKDGLRRILNDRVGDPEPAPLPPGPLTLRLQ